MVNTVEIKGISKCSLFQLFAGKSCQGIRNVIPIPFLSTLGCGSRAAAWHLATLYWNEWKFFLLIIALSSGKPHGHSINTSHYQQLVPFCLCQIYTNSLDLGMLQGMFSSHSQASMQFKDFIFEGLDYICVWQLFPQQALSYWKHKAHTWRPLEWK